MSKNSFARNANLFIKRVADLLGSGIGLILLSPVFLVIAILIRASSKGTVFFQQERIGKDGKVFRIIKFRTMITGAENVGDGLRIKSGGDRRITKIGRILRVTSLDELPQLLNVFCGSMSLVGPRPPVTYSPYNGFANYPQWARSRFTMRPGITGLTQVTVRNSVSWDDRIKVDTQYIDAFSIWLDIKILIKTFIRIFKPQDIYNANLQQTIRTENKR